MKRFLIVAFVVASALAFAGCAALDGVSEDDRAKFAFQYGTLKAIGDHPERADRLVSLIEEARPHIENGAAVTIGFLEAELKERIDARDYAPEDKALFYMVIAEARDRLVDRVGDGVLNADQRLELLTVLNWIEGAASGRISP